MDKVMRMKERQEALDKKIGEINHRNFESMKEDCRTATKKKGERMDFLGRLHRERLEALTEDDMIRAQEARNILPKQIDQAQRLAEGVLKLKNEDIREQKHRQVLRTSNIELKVLEDRLKSTYAAKAAQVQLREGEARREDDKRFDKETSILKSRWYNNDDFDRRKESEDREKRVSLRNDLQDQLIANEISRRRKTEDEHRERKIVEEVSEVLRCEDLRLAEEKRERIARTRAEREGFFLAKETWKCKEKEALLDEFDRQAKVIEDKMGEEKAQRLRHSGVSRARDLMVEKAARRMLDDEVRLAEREDILDELVEEEKNAKIVRDGKEEIIRKEIVKRELLEDMKRQREMNERNKVEEARVDHAFGKHLAQEYDKALREENERQAERRRKGVRYGNDLRDVILERRANYAEEVMVRQQVRRKDEEEELRRLGEVALERSNMLNEHGPNLKGFLRAE